MGLPAARLADLHACPIPGHGVNPVVPACEPTVLICGRPAARIGDNTACGSSIVTGATTVLIGNSPAARLSDSTSHGGKIVTGCFTVLIGNSVQGGCNIAAAKVGAPFVTAAK